uniref:Uncharacterized protein n=1 Tax=Glossina pallidipes TaxID=7398 RepID=A0A1A9ZA74_GLOPL
MNISPIGFLSLILIFIDECVALPIFNPLTMLIGPGFRYMLSNTILFRKSLNFPRNNIVNKLHLNDVHTCNLHLYYNLHKQGENDSFASILSRTIWFIANAKLKFENQENNGNREGSEGKIA